MKKVICNVIIILISITNANSQYDMSNLNGYKIVYLPYKFSSMIQYISEEFKRIGYKVYNDEISLKGDADYKEDAGITLICQVDHDYSYPHTTISIKLINIRSETLFQESGNTRGKAFVSFDVEKDQKWVIDKLFEPFRKFRYSYDLSKSLNEIATRNLPKLELTGLTEDSIKSVLSSRKADPIEGIYKSYQNDRMPYYKLGIIKTGENYKAVIIETELTYWKPGELKATFEQSSLKGLYSTKWYMANKTPYETFASIKNEVLLTIELKDSKTGEKRQDTFIKMFPTIDDETYSKKENSKSYGSGFFMTTEGIIATNAHVVVGAERIEVVVSNEIGSFTYKAKILLEDTKNDVALIKIEDEKFEGLNNIPYGIKESSDVGTKVFTIGFPLNEVMGKNYKVTDGIISSKSGIADDVRYYQISVPLQPGNSGGPLFNKEGNVIGITSARLNSKAVGTQVENVNYAIKSSYLMNLFNMLPNSPKIQTTSKVASKELHEQVKILKNYVCLIKGY
jgi:S1-C subfamily serine protease